MATRVLASIDAAGSGLLHCNRRPAAASGGMKTFSLLSLVLLGACATDAAGTDDDGAPFDTQSVPDPDGKSDTVQSCGTSECVPSLCGYDCTETGAQCTRTCAPEAGRDRAFVRATVDGTVLDTRDTPYAPVWDLDNVLIYGCELWDFTNQVKDGLEIELQQLRHSSFLVNPNDPTRHDHKLLVYVVPYTGPGSYRGQAIYAANERSTRYFSKDACDVDITAGPNGSVHGTFTCQISAAETTSSVSVTGEFGCPIDAMSPVFSRWTPAL